MGIVSAGKASVILVLLTPLLQSLQAQEDFNEWKKKEDAKFQQYMEERDKEFVTFLANEWKQMQLMEGLVPFEKPKPVQLPVCKPPEQAPREDTSTGKTMISLPAVAPLPESLTTPAEKPQIDAQKNRSHMKFFFYGFPAELSYDNALKTSLASPINEKAISRFWERLSQSNYPDLLKQISYLAHSMSLNDWGILEFCHAVGKEINGSENEAILFTWFLASKSGYETKVGYSGNQVCLLTATANTLYGVPFFTFVKGKQRYYVVSLDPKWKLNDESIYTYEGDYPGATEPVKFSIKTPPTTEKLSSGKTLKFTYGGQDHAVPVKFSRDAVDFFEYYPQTNFEVYFGALPSTESTTSLLAGLRPLVQGKTEKEAANILLRFVQTAFRYKTDPEQFGREKPLFPDETLYYGYSDCEDRSILFAYLLRTLTGLAVIGLDYPGHIATAVKFSDDIGGDAVLYQGTAYVICDPTYENANVGDCMPEFKGVKPKIIRID